MQLKREAAVTDEERVIARHPLPWFVYKGKLRPQFPVRIVEVCDDNEDTVLPWQCFDHLASYAGKARLAKFIVNSVNSGRRIEEGKNGEA